MQVEVNKSKPFTWSPTSLKTFNTCQLKAWGTWWTPNPPPYVQTPAAIYGEKVHQAFEDAINKGVNLPTAFMKYSKWLQSVRNIEGHKIAEGKFAFDRNWGKTRYFSKKGDVWGRLIVDLRIHDGTHCAILDYKTGKSQYDDDNQLKLGMIAALAVAPHTETFTSGYIYLEEDHHTMITATREDVERYKREFEYEFRVMEEAWNNEYFEPTKNGLCKNFCTVTECPFHGR